MANPTININGKAIAITGNATAVSKTHEEKTVAIVDDSIIANLNNTTSVVSIGNDTKVATIVPESKLSIGAPEKCLVISPMGARGLQGPSGQPGTGVIELEAGENIGGHRAIVNRNGKAYYASSNQAADAFCVIGISNGAALMGTTVTITINGEMTEPSWNFTPRLPIFVGTNGTLTHTAPSSGYVKMIGFAITAHRIYVQIHQPIIT